MDIQCPHCRNPIAVTEQRSKEVVCPACGSSFRIEQESTVAWSPQEGGRRVGKFELIDVVGIGAFGTVYKARDPELDRVVAIKVPRSGNLVTPEDLDRFVREARSVAQLRHPSIVPVYEAGQADGVPYLVSEFVQGLTLADLLTDRRPAFLESARLVAATADALQYAHDMGVVHRDVKPSNILLGDDGTPHLMDFGLAKRDAGEVTMTIDGQVLGTPAYMSPEQARGAAHTVDGRSDVYSLGVILYQLVTGELPFRGNTRMLLHHVLHDEPRSPRSLNDRIPRDLDTITLTAMAKEPGRRYQSAREMADDLRRWLGGEPIRARPVGNLERAWRWCRRNPMVASLTAAISALLIISAVGATVAALRFQRMAEREQAIAAQERDSRAAAEQERRRAVAAQRVAEQQLDYSRRSLYALQLSQAAALWERNPTRGLELLDDRERCPPELRDFAWGFFYRLCKRDRLALKGHSGWVLAVAFSPDGSLLASAGEDGTVRLCDARTGVQQAVLEAHKFGVSAVAFAPDGRTLATGGGDNTAKLWDISTAEQRTVLQGHSDSVWTVAFSPEGKRVATGSIDRTVKLWDTATGQELASLEGHRGWINSVSFSPDGGTLASASWDETAKLWDLAAEKPTERASLRGHAHWVWSVAFAPDGKTVATGSEDKSVRVWDARTGQERRTLVGHTGGVLSLAFSADGHTLASGSGDQTVKLWDTSTWQERTTLEVSKGADFFIPLVRDYAAIGQERATLKGHTRPGYCVAYSPDGTSLATGSWDGSVRLWDTAKSEVRATLEGHSDLVKAVAFCPDGRTLVSASWDRTVKLWDPATGQVRSTLQGHTHWIWCAVSSPDSKTIATGSEDGTIRLWDAATGKCTAILRGHSGAVWSVAFSPDGRTLASASWEVKFWDLASKKEQATLGGHSHLIRCVAFSPDGRLLSTASFDRSVKVWSVAEGELRATLEGHGHWVWSVAFSPDGKTLASGSGDGTARLWDLDTGRMLYTLAAHTGGVRCLAFAPDGRTLATASEDMTVRLWDPLTGQERPTLRGHTAEVACVAFSPDGKLLASGSSDMTVRLWESYRPEPLADEPAPEDTGLSQK